MGRLFIEFLDNNFEKNDNEESNINYDKVTTLKAF